MTRGLLAVVVIVGGAIAAHANAAAPPAPKPEPLSAAELELAREELVLVRQELLTVRAELRRRKVEKEVHEKFIRTRLEQGLEDSEFQAILSKDAVYKALTQRINQLQQGLRVTVPRGPGMDRLQQELREQKAEAALQKSKLYRSWYSSKTQERIAYLERMEAVLFAEMERLHGRIAATVRAR